MEFTKQMTEEQRINLIIENAQEIKESAPAYNGLNGEVLLNAILEKVVGRAFEFDFLMEGKISVWDVIEEVAEEIEAEENEDFYVDNRNGMMNEYAEAMNYFEEQRKMQMNTYSRKFN